MFLLRSAFWLSVVILLLPADTESGEPAPRVGAIEALAAARAAAVDLSAFCDRNPDTCATGSTAFQVFAEKAKYGAYLLFDYLDGAPSGEDADAPKDGDTGPFRRPPVKGAGSA